MAGYAEGAPNGSSAVSPHSHMLSALGSSRLEARDIVKRSRENIASNDAPSPGGERVHTSTPPGPMTTMMGPPPTGLGNVREGGKEKQGGGNGYQGDDSGGSGTRGDDSGGYRRKAEHPMALARIRRFKTREHAGL